MYKFNDGYKDFRDQLNAIGLMIREMPGDGNCLFRALADQIDGSADDHYRHRQETCHYMRKHRQDFEPFVAVECTFDTHVNALSKDGTYAGNDAIVAFARNHDLNIVIHQLFAPVWIIEGSKKSRPPELHIAFHNGEHYSSVRKCGDDSCRPADIQLRNLDKDKTYKRPMKKRDMRPSLEIVERQIAQVMERTFCEDSRLIEKLLSENSYDVEKVVRIIKQGQRLQNVPEIDGKKKSSIRSRRTSKYEEERDCNEVTKTNSMILPQKKTSQATNIDTDFCTTKVPSLIAPPLAAENRRDGCPNRSYIDIEKSKCRRASSAAATRGSLCDPNPDFSDNESPVVVDPYTCRPPDPCVPPKMRRMSGTPNECNMYNPPSNTFFIVICFTCVVVVFLIFSAY